MRQSKIPTFGCRNKTMDRRVRSEIAFYLGGRRMTELVPSLRGAVHSVVVEGGAGNRRLPSYWLLAVFFTCETTFLILDSVLKIDEQIWWYGIKLIVLQRIFILLSIPCWKVQKRSRDNTTINAGSEVKGSIAFPGLATSNLALCGSMDYWNWIFFFFLNMQRLEHSKSFSFFQLRLSMVWDIPWLATAQSKKTGVWFQTIIIYRLATFQTDVFGVDLPIEFVEKWLVSTQLHIEENSWRETSLLFETTSL